MAMTIDRDEEMSINNKRIDRIHDLIENHVLHPQLNLQILQDALTLLNHEIHPNEGLNLYRLEEMNKLAVSDLRINNDGGLERSRISRYVRDKTNRMLWNIYSENQTSENRVYYNLIHGKGFLIGPEVDSKAEASDASDASEAYGKAEIKHAKPISRLQALAKIDGGLSYLTYKDEEERFENLWLTFPMVPNLEDQRYDHDFRFHGVKPKLKKTCRSLRRTWVKKSKNRKGFCRKSYNKK